MRPECANHTMFMSAAPAAASIATITTGRAGERAAARQILMTRAWIALGSTSR
jgi:hypothetical protein